MARATMIPAPIMRPRKTASSMQCQAHFPGSQSKHLLEIEVDSDGSIYAKTIGGKVISLNDK
jgi:hypothetical protein